MMTLITPFPPAWIPQLWDWVLEHPQAHFDDDRPQPSFDAFQAEIARRRRDDVTWGIAVQGVPAGFIGYTPVREWFGVLHGVVVASRVHRQGIASHALGQILAALAAAGAIQKMGVSVYAHNHPMRALLRCCGFHEEGCLRAQAWQHGTPVDVMLLAWMAATSAQRKAG